MIYLQSIKIVPLSQGTIYKFFNYMAKLPDGQFEVVVSSVRFVLEDQGKAERLYNKLIEYSIIEIPSGP